MVKALGMSRGGSSAGGGDRLLLFASGKALSPYAATFLPLVTTPIKFRTPMGQLAYRARDALAKILEAFVRTEIKKWVRTFQPEFYKEMFRLRGLPYTGKVPKPSYIGKLTDNIVYSRLAPGVREELRRKNPVTDGGHRKARHHQWLTEDIGHPKLLQHLAAVIALMKISDNWPDFMKLLDRALPRYAAMVIGFRAFSRSSLTRKPKAI